MPRTTKTPTQRLTELFLDLDGDQQAAAIDIFTVLHRRRTAPAIPQPLPVKKVTRRAPRAKKPVQVAEPAEN